MRVERLDIDGFGMFHDEPVGPFQGSLSIVLGPNEAGKSTLLAFIRTVLFGFPARGADDYYPPLNGGRHGGRLLVVDETGERVTIERYRGPRGGSVALTAADGTRLPESRLAALVGHASADLFRKVFGFDQDALRELKLLDDSQISGRIYSAGVGATNLPAAIDALRNRQQRIFTKGGRNQPVAEVLGSLDAVETELSLVGAHASEYGAVSARADEINHRLSAIADEGRGLSEQRTELERLQRGWDDWISLCNLNDRLDGLPAHAGFPEDAVGRLERLQDRSRTAEESAVQHSEDLCTAEKRAGAPIQDAVLLELSADLEAIRRARTRFDASVEDLPKRQAELRVREASLAAALSDLGQGWDEQRLPEFDVSLGARNDVKRWRDDLGRVEQTVREADGRVSTAEGNVDEAVDQENRAARALDLLSDPGLSRPELDKRRDAARSARTKFDGFLRAQQRRSDLEAQLAGRATGLSSPSATRRLLLPALLAFGGFASIAAGVWAEELRALLFVGPTLLVLALLGYSERRPPKIGDIATDGLEDLVSRARETETGSREEWHQALESLGPEPTGAHDLDAIDGRLDRLERALAAYEIASIELRNVRDLVAQREKRLAIGRDLAGQACQHRQQLGNEWSSWLRERDLPQTFRPETVQDMFSRIEVARLELGGVTEWRHRVADISRDIEDYRALVAPLALKLGLNAEQATYQNIARVADELITRGDRAGIEHSERERAAAIAEQAKTNLDRERQRRDGAAEELEALLEVGGTENVEEFRRRAAEHLERRKLEGERRAGLTRLQQLSGAGVPYERFRCALAATNREEIETGLVDVVGRLEALDSERHVLASESGAIDMRKGQLTDDRAASALRQDKESLIEQLRAHAWTWSVHVLAQTLLERTRRIHEEERQPGVLRRARKFFAAMTASRYENVYAPLGAQEVSVVERGGALKYPRQLSAGTKEQLYLALRFGLIQEFGEQEEHLPVIVDEVLVNSDPDRAVEAARAFEELSETNQVLVFTCHPHLVETFLKVAPGVQLLELASG